MADRIDPALARKLDAFTVPGLPSDFAGQVMSRLGPEAAPPLPRLRKPAARRWWRAGGSALGVIVAATISISAAASGYLGEPIRKAIEAAPVIGPVVERVVARPHPRAPHLASRAKPVHVAAAVVPAAPAAIPGDPIARRELRRAELRRAVRDRLSDDPRAQQWLAEHPRAAARIVRKAALREEGARDPQLRAARRSARERRHEALGLAPHPVPDGPVQDGGNRPGLRAERIERLRMLRERREQRRLRRIEAMDRLQSGDQSEGSASVR